jgi:hypothetical protein
MSAGKFAALWRKVVVKSSLKSPFLVFSCSQKLKTKHAMKL